MSALEKKKQLSLVDSHAHLDMKEFDRDRSEVVERAFQDGIRSILCPAELTKTRSIQKVLELTGKYDTLFAAAGIHPHQAKHFHHDCAQKIIDLFKEKRIKAVGEIGLDFHYNFSPPRKQEEVFRHQLNIAQDLDLPVIVHSRNSGKEVARAIEEERFTKGGVQHCFSDDWEQAKRMMDHNFFISFSGILTYPKAFLLREAAKKIPLERLLVETDSPFLVPLLLRGKKKRNEPAFVIEVAKALAELKDVSLDKLADTTSKNFASLFLFEIKNSR